MKASHKGYWTGKFINLWRVAILRLSLFKLFHSCLPGEMAMPRVYVSFCLAQSEKMFEFIWNLVSTSVKKRYLAEE